MRLFFHNRIPNVFHVQQCQAAESVPAQFLSFAAQIRVRPVAPPERLQRKFNGNHGCRLKDEKALGVAGEFYGNHDTLPDLRNQ